MAADKWFMTSIEQTLTAAGYRIVILSDTVCHLWMRWTTVEPKEHLIQRTKRGLAFLVDKYYCFDVYEDNEQEEAGDTLIHTFIKEPWPFCETRYFYFHGEIAGVASKSTTAIFSKHRIQPPSPLILRPNAPGDETNLFQFPATGQNWDKLAEATPDEDATMVRNWLAAPKRDLYNLDNPIPVGTIDKIIVKSRFKRITYPTMSYGFSLIKAGGVISEGTLRALLTEWTTYTDEWLLNPSDGQPWEWPDIVPLQAGVSIRGTGATWAMGTQEFVEVHFTP